MRIEQHPIITFNKGRKIQFSFDGKIYEGYEGEPIAAALHDAGIRVLGHSHSWEGPEVFIVQLAIVPPALW